MHALKWPSLAVVVVIAIAGLLGPGVQTAAGQIVPLVLDVDVYAVMFLCGAFPQAPPPAAEGPVKPGNYQTAINVHNPNGGAVFFRKKAILLYNAAAPPVAPETPMPPGSFHNVTLNANWGLEIDCNDIRRFLLPPPVIAYPTFIKGWVVIEVPTPFPFTTPLPPLDVVAAYTAHGIPLMAGPGGFSIDVEPIRPTRVRK